MHVVMFYHSALSDWNHGNAHFLRGIATELANRGHKVVIYEERNAWSVQNLLKEQGQAALEHFRLIYRKFETVRYDPGDLDLEHALRAADLVIVHEWNDPALVKAIGLHRSRHGHFELFFHDTHHRSVTDPNAMAAYDLRHYDGVLVYGESLREVYLARGWSTRVHVWHEAADTVIFRPMRFDSGDKTNGATREFEGDVVWIGNWGDDERAAEIKEFLIDPVHDLGLRARVYGVRYPPSAIEALNAAGIEYAGWLPNFRVPEVFGKFRVTIHIPRRPYVERLPGVPTIRPFEAMACEIPLVSAYWSDTEGLFTAGSDYRMVRNGEEMKRELDQLLTNPRQARELAAHGRQTIIQKHTCIQRVNQLLDVLRDSERAPAIASGART